MVHSRFGTGVNTKPDEELVTKKPKRRQGTGAAVSSEGTCQRLPIAVLRWREGNMGLMVEKLDVETWALH